MSRASHVTEAPITHQHVSRGLRRIRQGLDTNFKYECKDASSFMCEGKTEAWGIQIIGARINVRVRAFSLSYQELATAIVHECSHVFDNTNLLDFDERNCGKDGCPESMSPVEAYANADSYAKYAEERYR